MVHRHASFVLIAQCDDVHDTTSMMNGFAGQRSVEDFRDLEVTGARMMIISPWSESANSAM